MGRPLPRAAARHIACPWFALPSRANHTKGAGMDPTWILLADEGRARILETRKQGEDLAEIEEMTDPAAHADNADLRRDAYGRRGGDDLRMGGNATSSAGEEKLDHEA